MSDFIKFFNKLKIFLIFPLMHIFVLHGIIVHEYWYIVILCGMITFYPIMNLGQSIGYHKMFAHRAFTPKKWYPYLSAFIGSISFFGDPLRSAFLHRIHHKYVDTKLDPHSPIHGRFNAYIGWLYSYVPSEKDRYIVLDLVRQYPWLITYSKYEWLVFLIFHITTFLLFPTLFLIIMIGCLLALNNAFFVNAFSHNPLDEKWQATDIIWLAKYINPAFLHKQHHDDPGKWDYSNNEVKDFTKWFIKNCLAETTINLK